MELTERQRRLYETIAVAARDGRVCPTNKDIAELSGLVSASAVADALGRLQKKGAVEVVRFNRSRIVRFPTLGLTTAEPPKPRSANRAPHWRQRNEADAGPTDRPRGPAFFPPPALWRRSRRLARWKPASCQFIAGSPESGDARKCGRPVAPRSPYCERHHAVCYLPPPTSVDLQAS